MKRMIMVALVAALATSCQAQEQQNDKENSKNSGATAQQIPKGNWKVNKETDENGNIVRYDSIYSWSSSGNYDQMKPEDMDSIVNAMQARFSAHMGNMPSMMGQSDFIQQFFNGNPFGNDSTQISSFDAMRKQMEAMQQQFMQRTKPQPIIPAEPEDVPEKKTKSL